MTQAAPAALASSTVVGASGLEIWRRFRVPVALIGLLIFVATVTALIKGSPRHGYLDPASYDPGGSHALAALLAEHGVSVKRVSDLGAASNARSDDLVIVTSPYLLDADQFAMLDQHQPSLLVVEPDAEVVSALVDALDLPLEWSDETRVRRTEPGCQLQAATTAGDADAGGFLYTPSSGAVGCYWHGNAAALVSVSSGGRSVVLLGTGTPLINSHLASSGNAALALGLTEGHDTVYWLMPTTPVGTGGMNALTALIPRSMKLAAWQLGIAVVLLALWRGRRFGPVVSEPIPMEIPAAEVVAGRGRLYRRAKAYSSAASALREAALARLTPALQTGPGAPSELVIQRAVEHTGRSPEAVRALLYGSSPDDDQALVRLASDLDALASAVLSPEVHPT